MRTKSSSNVNWGLGGGGGGNLVLSRGQKNQNLCAGLPETLPLPFSVGLKLKVQAGCPFFPFVTNPELLGI